ncbi:hypothetical protein Taro_017163 [Colocasia esculenta]|uniref:Uncharacterized protein n=1 Tax=Colocasia esculenta TaxID=4460 RepID=A0A843UQG2_COLES|nr:hypothetical protein [Colocasia esculenta]
MAVSMSCVLSGCLVQAPDCCFVVCSLVPVRGGTGECVSLTSWRVRVTAALAGEGLVIPTGPCSRGSPPYFLQLGAYRSGSSVSDWLRRRLWCLVLSAAVRGSVVSSCT